MFFYEFGEWGDVGGGGGVVCSLTDELVFLSSTYRFGFVE